MFACRLRVAPTLAMKWDGSFEGAAAIRDALGKNVETGTYESLPPSPFLRLYYAQGYQYVSPGDIVVSATGAPVIRMSEETFNDKYERI